MCGALPSLNSALTYLQLQTDAYITCGRADNNLEETLGMFGMIPIGDFRSQALGVGWDNITEPQRIYDSARLSADS